MTYRVGGMIPMNMNAISKVTKTDLYETSNRKTSEKGKNTVEVEEKDEQGVVYEHSTEPTKKATYSINKMSAEDRKKLVNHLKEEQEVRKQQLIDLVQNMMGNQAKTYSVANQDDSIWKFLASGDYEVSADVKAQAQEDISEDGYWGVKQTSERLFDFASALAGDDVDKMKEMQAAVQKGFDQATKAWGQKLPSISQETLDATNKLFEDYYTQKNQE